jgi:hypothetical protein
MIDLIGEFKTKNLSSKTRNTIFEILKDNMENYKIRYRDIFDYWFSEYHKPHERIVDGKYISYTSRCGKTLVYNFKNNRFYFHGKFFLNKISNIIVKNDCYFDTNTPRLTAFKVYLGGIFYDNFLSFNILPKFIVYEQTNRAGHIIILKYRNGIIVEYYKNISSRRQFRILDQWNSDLSYENQRWTEFYDLKKVQDLGLTILEWTKL